MARLKRFNEDRFPRNETARDDSGRIFWTTSRSRWEWTRLFVYFALSILRRRGEGRALLMLRHRRNKQKRTCSLDFFDSWRKKYFAEIIFARVWNAFTADFCGTSFGTRILNISRLLLLFFFSFISIRIRPIFFSILTTTSYRSFPIRFLLAYFRFSNPCFLASSSTSSFKLEGKIVFSRRGESVRPTIGHVATESVPTSTRYVIQWTGSPYRFPTAFLAIERELLSSVRWARPIFPSKAEPRIPPPLPFPCPNPLRNRAYESRRWPARTGWNRTGRARLDPTADRHRDFSIPRISDFSRLSTDSYENKLLNSPNTRIKISGILRNLIWSKKSLLWNFYGIENSKLD